MPLTTVDLTPTAADVRHLVAGRNFTTEQIARAARAAAHYAAPQLLPRLAGVPTPPIVAVQWVARAAAARLERHERHDEDRARAHLLAMEELSLEIEREVSRAAELTATANPRVWTRR